MIVVRNPNATSAIPETEIRELVDRRFAQIWPGEKYDPELHGYFVVAQPGEELPGSTSARSLR